MSEMLDRSSPGLFRYTLGGKFVEAARKTFRQTDRFEQKRLVRKPYTEKLAPQERVLAGPPSALSPKVLL
jgi:hypothetical protein